jgi:hypothetical protein
MEFAAHGDIKIKWLGNILVVKPSGSVNLEGAEYFAQWVNKQITDKNFTHWGRIIEFKDVDSLATPDAYQHLQSHLKEDIALGCVFWGWSVVIRLGYYLANVQPENQACPLSNSLILRVRLIT